MSKLIVYCQWGTRQRNTYRSSWRFVNKCQNISPKIYFGVKLYETWPPFTIAIMSSLIPSGRLCWVYSTSPSRSSLYHFHPTLYPKRLRSGSLLQAPLPSGFRFDLATEDFRRRPEEGRRIRSGHLVLEMPLCRVFSQAPLSMQLSFSLSAFISPGFGNHFFSFLL